MQLQVQGKLNEVTFVLFKGSPDMKWSRAKAEKHKIQKAAGSK